MVPSEVVCVVACMFVFTIILPSNCRHPSPPHSGVYVSFCVCVFSCVCFMCFLSSSSAPKEVMCIAAHPVVSVLIV